MPRGSRDSVLPHPAVFGATLAVAAGAWSFAGWLWSSGDRAFAASAFALGLSLGPCLAAYVTAPRALKRRQRRVVLFTGVLGVLAPCLLAETSLALEGFVLLLVTGTAGAAIGPDSTTGGSWG
jgi:hypothetical protein